jgi:hypothetical protein
MAQPPPLVGGRCAAAQSMQSKSDDRPSVHLETAVMKLERHAP